MDVKRLLEIAREKKQKPENVIARGTLMQFLTYDTDTKFLTDEICNCFQMKRQNVSHALKTIESNYGNYAFYKQCKNIIEKNKEVIRKELVNYDE